MRLPPMKPIRKTMGGVTAFRGYNHNLRIKDSEFFDMRNMTSKYLPVMASRGARTKLRTLKSPGGLFAHEQLCWTDGTGFYYGAVRKGDVTGGQKTFVRMGAFVLVWPDKAYYNTQTDEFGQLEARSTTKNVTAALCKLNGEPYAEYACAKDAPESPENGALWMDTSRQPNVLKQYIASTGMWTSIPTVYTKISGAGIGKGFAQNDGVNISGFMSNADLNGSFYLVDVADNYVIIAALIPQTFTQEQPITVSREMPDMDFVCENRNRIYGCSSEKHEIYASALGDPKNWNRFLGLSSDSYAATVGSTGEFTGVCAHQGDVLFFKENVIHRLMGTQPSNYELQETACQGVARGSEKSLQIVDEVLYYKSVNNVCALSYSLPVEIGDALGPGIYQNARGGAAAGMYWLCVADEAGMPQVYTYDRRQNAWAKQDELHVMDFATIGGELYMLGGDGALWYAGQAGEAQEGYKDQTAMPEGEVQWMLETGDIGFENAGNQYISRIQINMDCAMGAEVRAEMSCDGGAWEEVYRATPVKRRSIVLPIAPRRCRLMKIRLRGTGECKLYSMVTQVEKGSDTYMGA